LNTYFQRFLNSKKPEVNLLSLLELIFDYRNLLSSYKATIFKWQGKYWENCNLEAAFGEDIPFDNGVFDDIENIKFSLEDTEIRTWINEYVTKNPIKFLRDLISEVNYELEVPKRQVFSLLFKDKKNFDSLLSKDVKVSKEYKEFEKIFKDYSNYESWTKTKAVNAIIETNPEIDR